MNFIQSLAGNKSFWGKKQKHIWNGKKSQMKSKLKAKQILTDNKSVRGLKAL